LEHWKTWKEVVNNDMNEFFALKPSDAMDYLNRGNYWMGLKREQQ